MKLTNADNVQPQKDLVLVDIHDAILEKDGVYLGQSESKPQDIAMYFGTVRKLGPSATEDLNCPGLEAGDTVMFSQFAGHHISTREDKSYKVIPGYDIVAKVTDYKNIAENNTEPTADRVLISVNFVDGTEDGLVLSEDEVKDPRLTDLDYGIVLKVGPTTKKIRVGQLVAYEPWCGVVAKRKRSLEDSELKLIREDDILFIA